MFKEKLIVGFPLKTLLLEKWITNLYSINLLKMLKQFHNTTSCSSSTLH